MIRFVSFSGNNSNKWYYKFQGLACENEKKAKLGFQFLLCLTKNNKDFKTVNVSSKQLKKCDDFRWCFVIASCSRNSTTSLGYRTNEPLSVQYQAVFQFQQKGLIKLLALAERESDRLEADTSCLSHDYKIRLIKAWSKTKNGFSVHGKKLRGFIFFSFLKKMCISLRLFIACFDYVILLLYSLCYYEY